MRTMIVALAVAATASVGLAQNADKNSAGPTKNDYRLKVVEPVEGATVNGSTVRVVVDTRIPAEIGTEKRDVNSMPRPLIDVFVDNENKGTLREEQNVLEIDGVNAGAHKLVLVAKNLSNEIIGRQEINFTSTAGTTTASAAPLSPDTSTSRFSAPKDNDQAMNSSSSSTSTNTTGSTTYTAPSTTYSAPSTTSSSAPSTYSSNTSPSTSTTTRHSSARSTLPHTATSDPLVAGAGLALLIGGYALRRRLA
jgi:hypothetical protein